MDSIIEKKLTIKDMTMNAQLHNQSTDLGLIDLRHCRFARNTHFGLLQSAGN
jgi:hypothetical protein